jgi:hypothetical protein
MEVESKKSEIPQLVSPLKVKRENLTNIYSHNDLSFRSKWQGTYKTRHFSADLDLPFSMSGS